jgi:hypothetical protein
LRRQPKRDVSATAKAQGRISVVTVIQYSANQYDVIAGIDLLVASAIKPANDTIENRRAGCFWFPVNRFKLVSTLRCKYVRQIFLLSSQYVDGKTVSKDKRI